MEQLELKQTVFHDRHVELGAKMVDFVGWEMPIQYPSGIVQEHLATRNNAGLFDVSHMGRFTFRGADVPAFLQHVLSNNSAGLEVNQCQYTIIPNQRGGAVDDSFLYRFYEDEYLLVVNGVNRQKDWDRHVDDVSRHPLEYRPRGAELAKSRLPGDV